MPPTAANRSTVLNRFVLSRRVGRATKLNLGKNTVSNLIGCAPTGRIGEANSRSSRSQYAISLARPVRLSDSFSWLCRTLARNWKIASNPALAIGGDASGTQGEIFATEVLTGPIGQEDCR